MVALEIVDQGKSAGLVSMVAELLRPALEQNEKLASKINGSLALEASDRNAGVTLSFVNGDVELLGEADHEASVVISAPLLTLARLGDGGHALGGLLKREVKIKRGIRNLTLLLHIRKLLKS